MFLANVWRPALVVNREVKRPLRSRVRGRGSPSSYIRGDQPKRGRASPGRRWEYDRATISTGNARNCATRTDGTVWCWVANG